MIHAISRSLARRETLQQDYFRFLVPRFLTASRVVIADSEHTRRDILSKYGIPAAKVRVIYPGYDASVFFCADPTEPPRLHGDAALMVGLHNGPGLTDAKHRSSRREDLRRLGLRRVEAFSWRRTALAVSRLLDEAVVANDSRRAGRRA